MADALKEVDRVLASTKYTAEDLAGERGPCLKTPSETRMPTRLRWRRRRRVRERRAESVAASVRLERHRQSQSRSHAHRRQGALELGVRLLLQLPLPQTSSPCAERGPSSGGHAAAGVLGDRRRR